MSLTDFNNFDDFNDFMSSSEDEYHEEAYQADEEDQSDHCSSIDRDEDQVAQLNEDIDEYSSFLTDHEKWSFDQQRWDGIPNFRTYQAKKEAKGRKRGHQRKTKAEKEVKSVGNTKPSNGDKPKATLNPKAKTSTKKEQPTEQAVQIATDGEIHFDVEGNLWYSYKKNGVYLAERATFHHWIRADLCRSENTKGEYVFPRQRGTGNYDVTCYNEVQAHWGLERAFYAPVMFEWERLDRDDPPYQLDSLYYQDLLVIDYWLKPIRNFQEIPLVISSAFEGGFMEPATRMHSEMAYEDIRARMPPFVEVRTGSQTAFKALSKASTFSGRARHFREDAGAISWDRREGSDNIKSFIASIVRPVENSTRNSRDLTKDEIKKLRMMNVGTKPGRAKPGTSQKSKEKYIAKTRKAAGVTDATASMASINNTAEQNDESTMSTVEDAAPPRFVFLCTEPLGLRAMTEEQALNDPLVNMADPRNKIPKTVGELYAIRDALQVTVDHYKEIFGVEPLVSEGANYISEYCNIQDQMDDVFQDDATALRRLGPWVGTVADWEDAEVNDDPCIGRRNYPFGYPVLPLTPVNFRF